MGNPRELRRHHRAGGRRGGSHGGDAGDLRRGGLEPAASPGGPPGSGSDRAAAGRRPPHRQHVHVPGAPPAARARGDRGAPQRDQVPVRSRRRHGRCAGRVACGRGGGADAGRARRAQPGAVRRLAHAARRADASPCGWSATPPTRSSWRASWRSDPRWRACTTRDCPIIRSTRSPGRCCPDGFGGMLSFELAGGAAAVGRLLATLAGEPAPSGREALIAFAPSFGDVTTTWTYPARTSHRPLSDDERAKLGIGPGLVRLSVGIEDVEDLKEALDLGAAGGRGLSGETCLRRRSSDMSDALKKYGDLLAGDQKALANLGTVMSNGAPQVTPVWFDYDGKFFRVNSAKGRVKDRNMRRNPAVAAVDRRPRRTPTATSASSGASSRSPSRGPTPTSTASPRSTSARTGTPTGVPARCGSSTRSRRSAPAAWARRSAGRRRGGPADPRCG